MIRIMISDLTYLNEAAKALKQRNFMWYKNLIIGVDNFDYIIYGILDTNKLSVIPDNGIMMNQRDLSKVMKSITTESYFDFENSINKNIQLISTVSDSMTISSDVVIMNSILHNLNTTNDIEKILENILEEDMSSRLSDLYSMTKYSGILQFKYDNSHIMTIIPGVLPLSKTDKIYMKLKDHPEDNNIFVVRFRIKKKIFDTYVYLKFIKV